jgi:hypothetical protein
MVEDDKRRVGGDAEDDGAVAVCGRMERGGDVALSSTPLDIGTIWDFRRRSISRCISAFLLSI